jgi:hypothetical protein
MSEDTQEIKIIAEPQMDPTVCRFVVGQDIHNGLLNCTSKEMAKGSPLLEELFNIADVRQVMIAGNTVTISKINEDSWAEAGKQVGTIIREKIASTTPNSVRKFLRCLQPRSTQACRCMVAESTLLICREQPSFWQ